MANVDVRSAYIAEIETTRLVGMAANLAVNIRGQDVVESGEALKKIAAQELGVDGLNFRSQPGLACLPEATTTHVNGISPLRGIVFVQARGDESERQVWRG